MPDQRRPVVVQTRSREQLEMTQRLRDAGLRVTAPRLEILRLLATGEHYEVEALTGAARERLGTLTSQAVYDILRNFLQAGLAAKVERPGLPAVFESRVDPHHHALCTGCGRIVNVDARTPAITDPVVEGWELQEPELFYSGRCAQCLAKNV